MHVHVFHIQKRFEQVAHMDNIFKPKGEKKIYKLQYLEKNFLIMKMMCKIRIQYSVLSVP